jgi:hypothetical protein
VRHPGFPFPLNPPCPFTHSNNNPAALAPCLRGKITIRTISHIWPVSRARASRFRNRSRIASCSAKNCGSRLRAHFHLSRPTNRDLLFGLLALQLNFIDRDALVGAFDRWTVERSRPLDRILLERGALSPSRHMLLAGLVQEHIKLHGGDPEQSLQHLSSIGSVREDSTRFADADLHASLAHVSAARPDGDLYRTVTRASLGEASSIGSRSRVLRPHAKGGLGQVSVTLDQELDRPVALKEIQDHRADEPLSRARFVQEAEITGKLEHPGIIPVYGLGGHADGRPYYAMLFIRGDSLKEAIAAFHGDEGLKKDSVTRMSRLRELLRRFTDVCNATAYAHSRGVLHRDLKPGNTTAASNRSRAGEPAEARPFLLAPGEAGEHEPDADRKHRDRCRLGRHRHRAHRFDADYRWTGPMDIGGAGREQEADGSKGIGPGSFLRGASDGCRIASVNRP